MTEGEDKCKRDHDLLVAHLARFDEYTRAMEDRLGKLNELREQTSEFQQAYLRYDVYLARQKELDLKIEANYKNLDDRVGALSAAQSQMLGMGRIVVTVATLAGGLIGALLGHVWK